MSARRSGRGLVARMLAAVVLATAASLTRCAPAPEPPEPALEPDPERPNILFVFTDDHAAHAIGAYGGHLSGFAPTPNIDRLAREGMLFRNAFVTNSICVPSRATILTGTHTHVNGAITNAVPFDGSQPTFPKLLRAAGYQTALIGKWHGVPRHYGVRTDRYKLIHYPTTGEWELFDLERDPHELRSVHRDPAYAAVVARMEARLESLREQYDVPAEAPAPAGG